MKRTILIKILHWLSSRVINKYKPLVIGITGSVGKTSTKEAIAQVLESSFSVRKTGKNYNNELGVPLTILGYPSANRSLWGWVKILLGGFSLLISKRSYPSVLVLELGADRLGDIAYLTSLTKPKIGVLTALGPSHLEYFGSLENIVKEKSQLLLGLPKDGTAILNHDDPLVATLVGRSQATTITYGFLLGSDLQADDFKISEVDGRLGISFKVSYLGNKIPVFIAGVLGKQQASAALAALAVSTVMNVSLLDAVQRLRNFQPVLGRMNMINGIKNSLLIDDTYNSSPQSAKAAIEVLSHLKERFPAGVIIALGDMLELGQYSKIGHQEVGRAVAAFNPQYLVTVGTLSKDTAEAARQAGMPADRIFSFDDVSKAGKYIQSIMPPQSLILIKGSQGIRMEKIVKELMAEPLRATELLVRQTGEWADR